MGRKRSGSDKIKSVGLCGDDGGAILQNTDLLAKIRSIGSGHVQEARETIRRGNFIFLECWGGGADTGSLLYLFLESAI